MKLRKLLFALLPFLAVSCFESKEENKPEVTIPATDITFFAEGGEKTVKVLVKNTDELDLVAWTDSSFTEVADWIDISGDLPSFKVKASLNEDVERTAVLRAVASNAFGKAEAMIPVIQAGRIYDPDNPDNPDNPDDPDDPDDEITLEIDVHELEFTAEGGSAVVTCTTNANYWYIDWTEEDMETEADWIDYDVNGLNDDQVRIVVAPNTGEERIGYFFVLASFEDLWENEDADYEWDVIEIHQAAAENPDPGTDPGTDPQGGWTKVNSTSELVSGYYLIACESESVVLYGCLSANEIDSEGNCAEVTIKGDTIVDEDGLEECAFWYDASNGSLRAHDGYYINWTSSSRNGLATSNSPATLTVTISGGDSDIKTSSNSHLRFNAAKNQLRFRFYNNNYYTAQKAVQLYKMPELVTVPSFSVSTTMLNVGPKATEATFSIEASAEVEWTAVSSNADFALSAGSGSGSADIKISFTANPNTTARSATITVATGNEEVETKSWTITVTQGPASAGDIEDGTPGYNDHLIARRNFKRL